MTLLLAFGAGVYLGGLVIFAWLGKEKFAGDTK